MHPNLRSVTFILTLFILAINTAAADRIASIIIDDVGYNFEYGQDIIDLPASLTIAIAHPYPATIAFLKNHLDEMKQQGITLIPVSQLIQITNQIAKQRGKQHVACTGTTCSGL